MLSQRGRTKRQEEEKPNEIVINRLSRGSCSNVCESTIIINLFACFPAEHKTLALDISSRQWLVSTARWLVRVSRTRINRKINKQADQRRANANCNSPCLSATPLDKLAFKWSMCSDDGSFLLVAALRESSLLHRLVDR